MRINRISLNNYRIYKGLNTIEFNHNPQKNLFIVAGNNGYGKTSFLTSLVWCLYGKKMAEVEDAYRKDIYSAQGYRNYVQYNMNKLALEEGENAYYVEISFKDFKIPFLTTEEVIIKREYNVETDKENVSIYIDGYENELTKEVGPEIFINDFILPKEIAKFFFFDSEKIVSIAESKSIEEKRNISKAYSEVLGIKKYENLKDNLNELRLRFKSESAGTEQKVKFDTLKKEIDNLKELIESDDSKIKNLKEEKELKKLKTEQLQEKLIREGQSLTINELNALRKENDVLLEKGRTFKRKLNDLIDLIPFAMVIPKMEIIKTQIENENKLSIENQTSSDYVLTSFNKILSDASIRKFINECIKESKKKNFTKDLKKLVNYKYSLFSDINKSDNHQNSIHSFTKDEQNEFFSIILTLKGYFREQFNHISYDHKQNQIDLRKISRKLSDAEKKEDDLIISSYRNEKDSLEKEIHETDVNIIKYSTHKDSLERDAIAKQRLLSELSKNINLNSDNILKDEISGEIISKLEKFLIRFKKEKKIFLEKRILDSLNMLMHKKDFISIVKVEIDNELIEINLYRKNGKIIPKHDLSKGEQQLYATAVLKALVEESNIKFPVFIDSPLQKFDTKHSNNILKNFYPHISEQVVICPLLEKELTEKEFKIMQEMVEDSYIIVNKSESESVFEKIIPADLFLKFNNLTADVF